MTKEEIYKSCSEIDAKNCELIVDKINEITVLDEITDEQKLYAINIILNRNLNTYISSLKNENSQLRLNASTQWQKLRNMETKYREHLEHSQKEIETLNHIIQDATNAKRTPQKEPVKRFVVKLNKSKN